MGLIYRTEWVIRYKAFRRDTQWLKAILSKKVENLFK